MIVFHPPKPTVFRGVRRQHTHLASTLSGAEGTRELVEFGRQIGMREEWLQDRGHWKEHFDLFAGRIELARKAGAKEIPIVEFLNQVTRAKRGAEPL